MAHPKQYVVANAILPNSPKRSFSVFGVVRSKYDLIGS